jgi:hypothetical protein
LIPPKESVVLEWRGGVWLNRRRESRALLLLA